MVNGCAFQRDSLSLLRNFVMGGGVDGFSKWVKGFLVEFPFVSMVFLGWFEGLSEGFPRSSVGSCIVLLVRNVAVVGFSNWVKGILLEFLSILMFFV